jgi:hypothetical protein
MFDGLEAIFSTTTAVVLAIMFVLAAWKVIDIVVWLINNVSISIGA